MGFVGGPSVATHDVSNFIDWDAQSYIDRQYSLFEQDQSALLSVGMPLTEQNPLMSLKPDFICECELDEDSCQTMAQEATGYRSTEDGPFEEAAEKFIKTGICSRNID